MDAREIAVISEGLSEEGRRTIIRGYGTHAEVTAPEVEPLWYVITKNTQDNFSITLTALGKTVRSILTENAG